MKLNSIYSSQKDFYGKANVIVEGEQTKLKSYSTIVAVKENNERFEKIYSNNNQTIFE